MEDLIKSYQETITALIKRRKELTRRVPRTRGEEHFALQKRIRYLYEEEKEATAALRMAVRSRDRGGGNHRTG